MNMTIQQRESPAKDFADTSLRDLEERKDFAELLLAKGFEAIFYIPENGASRCGESGETGSEWREVLKQDMANATPASARPAEASPLSDQHVF